MKKTRIPMYSATSVLRDGREFISGVLPPYDRRFLRLLKKTKGHLPKSVYDAALEHRIKCENYSYAAKLETHEHIKLVQTRDFHTMVKEIEILNDFVNELK